MDTPQLLQRSDLDQAAQQRRVKQLETIQAKVDAAAATDAWLKGKRPHDPPPKT